MLGEGPSSQCSYTYGDSGYWDARYLEEGLSSIDWYQRYSALRPFLREFLPLSSRVLMAGCGNALMSEDMVKDGYVDIVNIDISSVVIEIMRRKCAHIPQLEYMQMDVRDMSFFQDESFHCVIDKGTLDSLMCGTNAPLSAFQMLEEVSRILKPGGTYMLITYGDPSVRVPHLNKTGCKWKIMLYVIPRPGYQAGDGSSSSKSIMEPVPLTDKGLLPTDFILEDPDSHYIYICKKMNELLEDDRVVVDANIV
ncbi:methyltransferase-like protein 13 isoform X1 [Iris pallida]|uniref:Methyltransferase-like protein 13 isoform X1 n=1 Tax=Iris pallida TaxID=29817 RepID=A0AAX6HBD5_IRIPA|nr:methyltransferase-like protein 13 isoform X1 [Iris pallida]KAJ6838316.1 methyltransferase-like protein 13 isoform X1 [Iris pallida]